VHFQPAAQAAVEGEDEAYEEARKEKRRLRRERLLRELDESENEGPKPRLRAADHITFPAFPGDASQLPEWRRQSRDIVNSAAGRNDDAALVWWLEAENSFATYESLAVSAPFTHLDRVIVTGISKILSGELKQDVGLLKDQAARSGTSISGRQIY
jgi:hypothetical protein